MGLALAGGGAGGFELALAGVVDGFPEDPGHLLGSVEAHRVLGGDEVESPLRLLVEIGGRPQVGFGYPGFLDRKSVV